MAFIVKSRLMRMTEKDDGEEDAVFVTPGDLVASEADFMRGHGTFTENGLLLSSIAGHLLPVNKLMTVQGQNSRYMAEVGDIVVARINQVQQKHWRVDMNASQDARLKLSAISLPGGIQRRKLESDELEIRKFFIEGELLSAEIQAVHQDGSISLHTRNTKYGKLNYGILLKVSPKNIQRSKNHLMHLEPCDLDIVIGLNGYIWVGAHALPVEDDEDQYKVPERV
jgi:exosome complex component RRP4